MLAHPCWHTVTGLWPSMTLLNNILAEHDTAQQQHSGHHVMQSCAPLESIVYSLQSMVCQSFSNPRYSPCPCQTSRPSEKSFQACDCSSATRQTAAK